MRLTPLEAVLNRNIAASSAARSLCRRLDAKVLALHVDGLPLSIYFESHGERMSLLTKHEGTPHATLSGTPLSFLRLAGPAPETALRAGAVQIQGDAEVAQTFSELLRAARPDLEEELSRVIGDVAAHQVGNVARSALGLARRASDTLARNVAEYLQEEGRDVPSRTEAEEFTLGVDTLRDATDRLEARINLLAQRRRGQQR
jgi:ubiquinone biosynthesis protein UbiJ